MISWCTIWRGGGHLKHDVHEDALGHAEGLEPELIIPSAKNDLLGCVQNLRLMVL